MRSNADPAPFLSPNTQMGLLAFLFLVLLYILVGLDVALEIVLGISIVFILIGFLALYFYLEDKYN